MESLLPTLGASNPYPLNFAIPAAKFTVINSWQCEVSYKFVTIRTGVGHNNSFIYLIKNQTLIYFTKEMYK